MRPSRGADQHWPCWWRAAGARLCCCGTLHHHNTYVITTTPPQQQQHLAKMGRHYTFLLAGIYLDTFVDIHYNVWHGTYIAGWYEYGAMAWAGLVMGISRQHTAYILTSEHCTAISHQQTTRAQHNLGTLLPWLNDI